MRIAYLGNFNVPWCTEVHVALSLESLGHDVTRIQEGETRALDVPDLVKGHDVFIHTQTYGFAVSSGSLEERLEASERIRDMGIPRVFFHLDRWIGLDREDQLGVEPWTQYEVVATADGGHDAEWERAGIRHVWSPPAVYHGEAKLGHSTRAYASDIAFVGYWRQGYHAEWTHRPQLIEHLRARWPRQLRLWPRQGNRQIRGPQLADLYASVKIVIGDSCLVPKKDGSPMTHFSSDRIPETLGRGGFLLHPRVEGVTDGDLYTEGEHLACWTLGDWDDLDAVINHYLAHPEERRRIAAQGWAHVCAHHTYRHRLEAVLECVVQREVA